MSWIPAIGPIGIGILAAIPFGIILLYFLKLRREPVEVPSTYLWQAAIEDLHVNSLLQRLRRSLLLALQLAAVALAGIALFRPGIRDLDEKTDRRVFLLDTSASMNATDGSENGVSRFEKAKQTIASEIESMSDSQTAMLITFDDRSETVQPFTSDRSRLRAALQRVTPTNRGTDILGALRAADGLANPRRSSEIGDIDVQVADAKPADLLIYSDGGFDAVNEFSLGNLIPQYAPIGSDSPTNLAITALSAQRNVERPGQVQVFATVSNLGAVVAETTATLLGDGQFLDAQSVSLAPDEQSGISFELETEEATLLELRIEIDDDMAVDNRAFTALAPMRSVRVLVVTPGNRPLEIGLGTSKIGGICDTEIIDPDFLTTDGYLARAKTGSDDLIIFDRCQPPVMPQTNTFFIGSLPTTRKSSDGGSPSNGLASEEASGDAGKTDAKEASDKEAGDGWRYVSPPSSLVVIDVDRSHPLLQYLELLSLLVVQGRAVEGPLGTTELIGADIGTVLAIAPRDGFQDLVLGFDLISSGADGGAEINTNWYAERSWPVFLLNLLRNLAGAAEASGATSYRPGQSVRVRLPSQIPEVKVTRLGGSGNLRGTGNRGDIGDRLDAGVTFPLGDSGILEFVDTEQTGNYRVTAGDRLVDVFSVNLFSRRESQLAVAKELEIGYEQIEGEALGIEVRREYWRWALLIMLAILGLEWYLYGKRVA